MKRYTPEELRKKTISELRLLRIQTFKRHQALTSFINSAEASFLPVVYMMRKSEDPQMYIIRTALSPIDIPGFSTHNDNDCGEMISYKTVKNAFMSSDQLNRLVERLKVELTPRKKQLPYSDEYAYDMPFFKVRHWLDVVGAWDEQEQNKNPLRIYEFRRKVAEQLKRAQKDDDAYDSDDEDSEPDLSLPINAAAAAAEKAKKQEMKKVTEFVKEYIVPQQDDDAPPLPKDDIVSMYRIWARGISAQSSALIVERMRTAFSAQPVYISAPDNVLAFKGFALKTDDWAYVAPNDDPPNVFLREHCVFSAGVKSFSRTITDSYLDWYTESDYPKIYREADLKRDMRAILDNCRIVFPTMLRIKRVSTCGWYGVALRDDPDAESDSTKRNAALRAATIVERRMPGPDGALLESWPSMVKAMKSLNIGVFKLKGMIAQKIKDKDGAILAYAHTGTRTSFGAGKSPSGVSTSAK
jgi:hypothetical protein